jgi:hypothetical protein
MDNCRPGCTLQTQWFAAQTDAQFTLTGYAPKGILSGMPLQSLALAALISN